MPFKSIQLLVPAITPAPAPMNLSQMIKFIQLVRTSGRPGEWIGLNIGCMNQVMKGHLPAVVGTDGSPLFREPVPSAFAGKVANEPPIKLKEDMSLLRTYRTQGKDGRRLWRQQSWGWEIGPLLLEVISPSLCLEFLLPQ